MIGDILTALGYAVAYASAFTFAVIYLWVIGAHLFKRRTPPVRIDEDFARQIREAHQFNALQRPRSFREPAKKGIDRDRLARVSQIGDRRSAR